MKIIFNKKKINRIISTQDNLGFVPTMGSIHKGHVSLIKKSKTLCKKTMVSIYVNKPQFNKRSDFKRYPRNIKRDIDLLKKNKVDFLYLPTTSQIYPNGTNKKIKIHKFSKKLCGKSRPGHFVAVVNVIDNFIKLIKPKKIFLGEKDYQQLKIIEEFVLRNKINTKIVMCRTIRENNGVACSSRNLLLNQKQMDVASKVYKLVYKKKFEIVKKNFSIKKIKHNILKMGVDKIEYFKIFNINKLFKTYDHKRKFRIFFSYYLGSVRLIDNIYV